MFAQKGEQEIGKDKGCQISDAIPANRGMINLQAAKRELNWQAEDDRVEIVNVYA